VNILVLNHSSGIGGAARSLAMSIKVLEAAGCGVHVLSPPGSMCEVFGRMGAKVTAWLPPSCYWLCGSVISTAQAPMSLSNLLNLLRLPLLVLKAAFLVRRLLNRDDIHVIYLNSIVLFPLALVLNILKRNRNIRVIWHLREVANSRLPSRVYSFIIRSIAGCSDQILAITTNEAVPFADYKVTIIHNTVESSWLERPMPAEGPQLPPTVSMASDFQPGKGITDFLQMARIVIERIPDATCTLYTTMPTGGRIDVLMYNLIRHVSPVARLLTTAIWEFQEVLLDRRIKCVFNRQMTPEEYAKCCVYVRADETGSPWGRDIIEAMCSGLPVVATGSYQGFVVDGQTGFLAPPGRPDLLADFVERLLRDPELRNRMGKAARIRAGELFARAIYEEKLLRAFNLKID
jgi:glycosyltransferase involved in cell wall biosynthesis